MEFPSEFLESLIETEGFNRNAFVDSHLELISGASIRLNHSKQVPLFKDAQQVPWCTNGRYLAERPYFYLDPFFHAGCYYVQEASSMFLEHILMKNVDGNDSLKILDLCAAPGGKTTIIKSVVSDSSLVIANEVISKRVPALCDNVSKWGCENIFVTNNDPAELGKLIDFFDVIVVDAPCSGSGMFRKDRASINHWSLQNVEMCSKRQRRILADILPSLKPGGLLVYSTCSYSSMENEEIADWLMDNFPLENVSVEISPDWGIVDSQSGKNKAVGYRFYPYNLKGEGFYATAFRKNATATVKEINFKTFKEDKLVRTRLSEQIDIPDCFMVKGEKLLSLISHKAVNYVEWLIKSGLRIVQAGLPVGEFKGSDFIPSHALALSSVHKKFAETIEIDEQKALKFLSGDSLKFDSTGKNGWKLITYKGVAMGWSKLIADRCNNYYPKYSRIRDNPV